MTTRTASGSGGTTATLSYDGLDDLVRWNDTNTTTNEEWYLYDASGQRLLRRSQTGTGNSNTRYTITAFGLEDHIYDGGGNNLNNKYYYYLAGRLIGLNTGSPNFLFTDALGSVVSSITNTANSASVKGNQVYGPYGNNPYSKGTMGTTKGYTGQYNDSLTQLDYYGARYYDPLVGVFLSADSVQGNLAGTDPYNYVGSNPETYTDPSGEMYAPPAGAGSLPLPPLPPWQLPGGSQSTQNSNVQPDTCTQMAQTGHPCNVQAAAQGPGQVGEYQRPGLVSVGCVDLFVPCVLVTTTSPERSGPIQGWSYPTFPVNLCVPYCTKGDDVGEGEEGVSNGKESDLTKLLDSMLGDLLAADDGSGGLPPPEGELVQGREELGMPSRSANPDDGQTLAKLHFGDQTFTGVNGGDPNKIVFQNLSQPGVHAEIDALNQLATSGSDTFGGSGKMLTDRKPCIWYCFTTWEKGNIPKAVDQLGLRYLEIRYYEPGAEDVLQPGGTITIIEPNTLLWLI